LRRVIQWPQSPQGFGAFTFPDPLAWPADAVEAFRRATEPRSLMDVSVFRHSDQIGAFHMEDAILTAQLLPICQDEWTTELGYPVCVFKWGKLSGYKQTLEAAGYRVWTLEPAAQETPKVSDKVVSITSARKTLAWSPQKWA
jgi:hypothetical protein